MRDGVRQRPGVGLAMAPWLLGASVVGALPVVVALGRVAAEPGVAGAVWADGVLWQRLARTLGLGVMILVLTVPWGWVLGWLLARTDLPGRRGLVVLLPLPLLLPPLVHVLSWYGLLGLRGVPAIVLVYWFAFTPLVAWLGARALSTVGRERYETALLLGGRRAVVEDEWRQSFPAALAGGGLVLVFLLSDYAVADFLTAVGPKVTVYADSLYRYQLGSSPAAAASAALPGLILGLGALLAALGWHRRVGMTVGGRFTAAPPFPLGLLRPWCAGVVWVWVAGGALLPVGVLGWQTGSLERFLAQGAQAADKAGFSLMVGAGAATGMVLLALPLAWLARRARHPCWVEGWVAAPLAVPAVLHGLGLVQMWNQPGLDAVYLGPALVWMALMGRYLMVAYLPLAAAAGRVEERWLEAARLGGAGGVRRAWHLVWPWMRGTVLAAWCLAYGFVLRDLDTLLLLRGGQRTLTFHLHAHVVFATPADVAALALWVLLTTWVPWAIYLGLTRRPLNLW